MIYIYAIIYVCIVSISKERGRIGRAALNNRKRAQLIPAVRMMKQDLCHNINKRPDLTCP